MRIPFPERITPWHAGCFAAILCFFEMLQGTPPLFAGCVFAYIMMATLAFNMVGGLYRASGAYIFANAMLSLIVALCCKVCFGESADSNLRDPITTILVYTAGMAGMLFAAAVSRKLILKVPLLERGDVQGDTRQIAVGCMVIGVCIPYAVNLVGSNEPGTLSSALNQLSQFFPLGLLLAVYDEIRSSHGKRSMNIFVIAGSLYMVAIWGIMLTSKQGLLTPLATYVVVCGAMRYKFRIAEAAGLAVVCFVMFYYLVPYSQVVRNYTREIGDAGARFDASVYWLENLDEVRAEDSKSTEDILLSSGPHYYNEDLGFLERLSMVAIDDALIDVADNGPKFGYLPLLNAVQNIVPHFLWPDKPSTHFANVYGHEIGVLGEEDLDTSVAFGPAADGFNMGGWVGVFVFLPIVLTFMFTVVDSVAGSIKKTPWGLAFTIVLFHLAPEGALADCVTVAVQTTVIIIGTILMARYVLPLLGSLFFPERSKSVLLRKVREFPKTAVISPPEISGGPV